MGCALTKRVLVTGEAGSIGPHFCERLVQDGHKVLCVEVDEIYNLA